LMKSANINRFMRSGLTILYQMISFGFHATLFLIYSLAVRDTRNS